MNTTRTTSPSTTRRSIFAGFLLAAAALVPNQAAVGQAVVTYFNRNITSEANTRIKAFAAAGHKILCVAFPPAGGNRFSIVTDRTFFNRNVPSELHSAMLSLRNSGHKIQCVAFPPAGGNRWSVITDRSYVNRNVPSECHTYMGNLVNAGHRVRWVSYPPAGGNSWSILTNKSFVNRNVPSALHSRMISYRNAGHLPTCVAFPPAGGNRWSVMTNKGSFYNWGVPSECHRVMNAMVRVPGGPLRCVAFDPDRNGFSIISAASPYGLPAVISTSTETLSIDKFASGLRSKLSGLGMKYGFVIRYGAASRSYQSGLKRTIYTPPAQEFTIYDRFNPASVSKTATGVAVLRALQNRGVSINEKIYKYLPSFWYKPASVQTITFKELLSHTSGFRNGAGYDYDNLKTIVAAGVSLSNKFYDYENVNFAVARIVCVYLDYYNESGVTNHAAKTSSHFAAFVRRYVTDPCGAPSVVWKPDAVEPTLFFPNPPGSSTGTTYGDWTLRAGPAGCHISLAEQSQMLHLMRNSTSIIGSTKRSEMDTFLLGWDRRRIVRNGSYLMKNGIFPASGNGGAGLRTFVIKFSSGVQIATLVNGDTNYEAKIQAAYNEAWSPKTISLWSLSTSIPNVTKTVLVARGTNLHLTTRVLFGGHTITSKTYTDPTKPYFRVISSTYVQIHPPQGIVPGSYSVRLSNGLSTSAAKTVAVTKPLVPTMVCTPTPIAGRNFAAVVAKGGVKGVPPCWLAISPSNKPSALPNIFNFGIGDSFRLLFFWPIAQRFNATTDATTFNLPSLASLKGETWYFQALYGTAGLPLPVSNVERISFR